MDRHTSFGKGYMGRNTQAKPQADETATGVLGKRSTRAQNSPKLKQK